VGRTAAKARPERATEKKGAAPVRPRPRSCGLRWLIPLLFLGWLAFSHLVVRVRLEHWLQETFAGRATVGWALVRPDLEVVGFGIQVESQGCLLAARRVRLKLDPWALLGGPAIRSVQVEGFEARIVEGAPIRLFRRKEPRPAPDGEGVDLDPVRLPPLGFLDVAVRLGRRELFRTGLVRIHQTGDRSFDCAASAGRLAGVLFERLTTRLIPRAGHLVFGDLRLRAFNGMLGGVVDVDLDRAGAVNGELEAHFLEVERIWRELGWPYAEKRRGDLSGRVAFQAARPALSALHGAGRLELRHARFYSPLSFHVLLVLEVPAAEEAMLNGGELKFSFEKGLLYLEQGRFKAHDFALDAQGILSVDGRADLEVHHAGTTVAVRGPLKDPEIKVLPLDSVTAPFDRIFRERVKAR